MGRQAAVLPGNEPHHPVSGPRGDAKHLPIRMDSRTADPRLLPGHEPVGNGAVGGRLRLHV